MTQRSCGEHMNKKVETKRKNIVSSVLAVLVFGCLLLFGSVSASAASKVTVYNKVDYARVYDFDYYTAHYSYVKEHYGNDPAGALRYFVKKGMKNRHRASERFDVNSYINANKSLRRLYKHNYKKDRHRQLLEDSGSLKNPRLDFGHSEYEVFSCDVDSLEPEKTIVENQRYEKLVRYSLH